MIVGFGRYPYKRPSGLHVDDSGGISLKSLMNVWARSQGVSEQQVLSAVRRNMFNEQRGAGHVRFSITTDEAGNTVIRVTPKGGGTYATVRGPGVATPARARGKSPWEHAPVEEERAWAQESWGQKSSGWKSWETTWKSGTWEDCTWEANGQDKGSSQWRWNSTGGGQKRGMGEMVQRWLAWALARGHEELGIKLKDNGQASLADLAAALRRSRPDLGVSDEVGLHKLLEETDLAGRFEVDAEGYVHKVHRDHRRPRAAPPVDPGCPGAGSLVAPLLPQPSAQAPPEPPGEYWTKYTDEGHLWWYYEGPLGRWWCIDAHKQVMPFRDDME